MAFDQDAVDEAVRISRLRADAQIDELQRQIDELKARPVFRRVVRQSLGFDDGPDDVYEIVVTEGR